MREISAETETETELRASEGSLELAAGAGSDDAFLCVEASSGILVLDRSALDPTGAARKKRRRRRIVLWGASVVACLIPGLVALLSHTGSQIYERRRLVAACESPDTERLRRVLACIDLCNRGSAAHCAKKGDIYAASMDASSASRAYREACQLGDTRACRMAAPAR